jgi:pteridine reductase
MFRDTLDGKNLLITGAAVRIGRSLAFAAAHEGANIIIHYGKSKDEAETTVAELKNIGVQAHAVQADLNDYTQVSRLISEASVFGQLYAVINSASIFEPLTWENTTVSDWNRHMNINLMAPFFISQNFAKSLKPESTGRIINILDWRAQRPGPDHFPYSISKAGLAALTKSLAQALAPRITVNAIALGAILPPIDGGDPNKLLNNVPLGRWGMLGEVDQTAVFLLTGPSYITGEIIHLDGGRHLI